MRAAGTAYCQPKSTWAERRTNASDTRRWPCSSSGTGLASAARAAAENARTPITTSAGGGAEAIRRIAPTATGTVTAMTATTYRSSRGGYEWDGDEAWGLTGGRESLSAAPGAYVSTR